MSNYPYIIQANNITMVIKNKPYTISNTHVSYEQILNCIRENDWETIDTLLNIRNVIADYTEGNLIVVGNDIYWKKTKLNGIIVDRIVELLKQQLPVTPLVSFVENLMSNSLQTAINEIYLFLEAGNLPLTSDGCFLAYKRVNSYYRDIHSNTILNKPFPIWNTADREYVKNFKQPDISITVEDGNTVISMDRSKVDPDRTNQCSYGLHFCSYDYLTAFPGERTIIVKINPKDVVSVPNDYNNTKGRCCKYVIVGEIPNIDKNIVSTDVFMLPVQENAINVIEKTVSKIKKPLSMTPNAIRKREKRRLEREAKMKLAD